MDIIHTNYSVSNEYWFKDKPYIDEILDIFTFPIRTALKGQIVDLRTRSITVFPGTFAPLKSLPPYLTSILVRVLQVAGCIFSVYFYRYTAVASGALVLKYLAEGSQVNQQITNLATNLQVEKTLVEKQSLSLDTTGLPMPAALHPYKKVLYEKIKGNRTSIEDREIRLDIYPFDRVAIKDKEVFSERITRCLLQRNDYFSFPNSTDHIQQWIASFSTTELFANCMGDKLTQNELQVVEHPGLYHIKLKIDKDRPDMQRLEGDQVALVTGANRYGAFVGAQCYGEPFLAEESHSLRPLALSFDQLKENCFLFIVAPQIPLSDNGKPYKKQDLEALFYRFYHAFLRVKEFAKLQKIKVHTSASGCKITGHSSRVVALMQIAAANLAGVNFLDYYGLDNAAEWKIAIQFYEIISRRNPQLTVDAFLTDMANRAADLGFTYKLDRD